MQENTRDECKFFLLTETSGRESGFCWFSNGWNDFEHELDDIKKCNSVRVLL